MKELKPFPDAANKTAVAMFTKKIQGVTTYPLDYRVGSENRRATTLATPRRGAGGGLSD